MTGPHTQGPPPADLAEAYTRMDKILRSRNRVLRMLTTGAGLDEVFHALCESIEEVVPETLCSVLRVEDGCLRNCAAPSLPEFYNEAIDGIRVAEGLGCCPHAAATGELVVAEDLLTHPFWADARELVEEAGLRSCWSYPIRDQAHTVVGTLALYRRQPHSPEPWELDLVEASAEIAGIAIDHRRVNDERRALAVRLRQVIDLVPHPIFAKDREGRFLLANEAVARLYGVTADELIGTTHDARLQPDSADLVRMLRQDLEVLESGRTLVIPEETFVREDGEIAYYQTTKVPYVQTAGGEPAVLGVAVDVTDRKRLELELESKLRRTQAEQRALMALTGDEAVLSGDTGRAFRTITEVVANVIEVDRVSVWLFNRERSELHQLDVYEHAHKRHGAGAVVLAQDCPTYFAALRSSRVIDAHDTSTDPRTAELRADYLEPLDIVSMLDAPIRVGGEVVGVVCYERCGTPRRWRDDERTFAVEVAEQAAQAVVQRERKQVEERLRRGERRYRHLSRELEVRVRERTRQLAGANAGLRRLTSELLVTEERERRRLAADLHDGPCQLLVLAQMKLAELRRRVDGQLRAEVEAIEAAVGDANRSSRSLTFELSPPMLHDLGLGAAAEWLAEELGPTYSMRIDVESRGDLQRLGERERVVLFRALRELLVNAGKHSGAPRASVRLACADRRVTVVVQDHGAGFDPDGVNGDGFGLASIRERVNQLGGTMDVASSVGAGTRVELAAPLDGPLPGAVPGENGA